MSRDKILNAIRECKPEAVPLPKLASLENSNIDLITQFKERLAAGGGECFVLSDGSKIKEKVNELFSTELTIYSNIENTGLDTLNTDQIKTPHELENVDLALIKGDFGVAENGAVWVDDQNLEYRAVSFITQHLVLILDKEKIVENMVNAYQNLKINKPGFGCFIAGPSKTADIEQSLVIGAHGARSAVVLLI